MNNGERHHFEKGSAMATAQEQASRFEQALISNSLKYDRIDDFERPMFKLNFGGGDFSFNHLRINILFDTDGRSAQFATSPIVSIPKDKTAQGLITCNTCNKRFRWVKFYIDDDNDLILETDAIIDDATVGDECVEMLFRAASIVDDCYGDFMRAIWA